MKLSKKLFSVLVAASLVVGTSVNAFAATNSDVITALTNAGVDSTYVTQAQTYLNNHSFTAAQLDTVKNEIAAVQTLGVKSISDYNNLSATNKAAVAADIKAAAAAISLTTTKNSDGSFVLTDSTGATVVTLSSSGTIAAGKANASGTTGTASNTTATNYGNMLALGAALAAAGAVGSVVASRKKVAINN